jgi:hypothetical protein
MPRNVISQRSIVKAVQSFREYQSEQVRVLRREPDFTAMLYERGFPDWLITHAESEFGWEWMQILMSLRNRRFFFPSASIFGDTSILGRHLAQSDASVLGEDLVGKLVAFASLLSPAGEAVTRSLELDGFAVNDETLALVPLEGPVSAQQEEDRLSALIKNTGLPNHDVILKHMTDANSLYTEGKNHPSLNESRSMLQALIDGVSVETNQHGGHSTALPGGTANRMDYLMKVNFLTADEKAAFGSAWGLLSAGSHPGLPERELARIGLVLALEFGQLLMLKYANWKSMGHQRFS